MLRILNLYAGIGGNRKWSRKYNKCICCNTIELKHKGNGLCVSCYEKNRDRTTINSRLSQKKYRDNNRTKIRQSQATFHHKKREELFLLLGDKCVVCGFTDRRALQIDHINGGGKAERERYNTKDYHRIVIKSILKGENKYQLLCANCNWIKRYERQEWGGGKRNENS